MHPLTNAVGLWTGTNAFRLYPTDSLTPLPSSVTVAKEANGWAVSVRYEWEHESEGPQSGTLLISQPDDTGKINAALVDTFHHKPHLGILEGRAITHGVIVEMEYDGWGWTIELTHDGSELTMTMCNVIPEGINGAEPGPYVVMDARWARL